MFSSNKDCSLSIELLPEFGWSIKNTPIYGPGSVFQGSVKLNISSENITVSRIRLAFMALEKVPPFELSPGVLRSTKRTIFAVQSILWESKGPSMELDKNTNHSFPFTLQMPMVQYPPSTEHAIYECKYQLIAFVETPESLAKTDMPIKTEIPLTYMPFIETSIMKSPFTLEGQKSHLKAKFYMNALSFVPNDDITLKMKVCSSMIKKKSNSTSLQHVTVNVKLIQTVSVKEFSEITDQVRTIASVSHKLPLVIYNQHNESLSTDVDLPLKIPADTTPSCDFSNLANISYKLQVNVEQKGPMGGIWNYTVNMDNTPITIGTLGYGIKNSSELQVYSSNQENMPTPKFMKAIEYEDALPLYDPTKLPTYESSSQMVIGC